MQTVRRSKKGYSDEQEEKVDKVTRNKACLVL